VAEHGNLVLTSFVVEAKKYNSTVWMSLAIDFFPEVLVIRNQNTLFRVSPTKNHDISNARCIVVH